MGGLESAIANQGGPLILVNVFLQQIGVPVPAEPTLLVAGSLVARHRLSVFAIGGAVLTATLIADITWYLVGRRYGARALRFALRGAAKPEERLEQTMRLFARWGSAAFALAKFIPGVPMVGPVLAGSSGITWRVFLTYDVVAMSAWAGAFTALGVIFAGDVGRIVKLLDRVGVWGVIVGAGVVVVLGARALLRRRRAALAPAREPLVVSALLVDVVANAGSADRSDRAA
ncbi:MAG TPA: DedA family protein [Polyangia bacterium]|jgi:membrane protein DedA with SNARE-associated domain|nr:DedA family protein [Polyangia bacterium]